MATPTAAKNKARVLMKILAILFQPNNDGAAREVEQPVGGANMRKAVGRVWLSAGVPSAGTGRAVGDFCLDTTNDDVYRYFDGVWDKINITT